MVESLPSFRFASKADTLRLLATHLVHAKVPSLSAHTIAEWRASRDTITESLCATHAGHAVAVRSSAIGEDSASTSMAGWYESRLNIPLLAEPLMAAIDAVCEAMHNDPRHQFFVQNMVANVTLSGVATTADMRSGALYYVLNYDDESGQTDTVTGGKRTNKTLFVYRSAQDSSIHSSRIRTVLRAVREVEAICGQPVDIEFALDDAEVFHLLQVRPLTTRHLWSPGTAELVPQRLGNAHDTVARLLGTGATDQPAAGVRGSRSLLGAMPDWNPVELIGPTPRPLASSLFRALITDVTWREARAAIGYHNPENTVLMHLIEGHPFIDVRASFSSLLPATIPATSAHQLIDTWLDRLETLPHLHDKVEFEIVRSCADFTLRTRIEPEFRAALGTAMASEAVTCLIAHTRSLLGLDRVGASLDEALVTLTRRRARQLEQGQNVAPATTRPVMAEPSLAARIATIRLDSAMPFAIAARHAFVAESLLRSAVERGAISGERVAVFRASLEGITSRFAALLREARGNGDVTRLLAEFGHLRPGTFDVRTPCYAQRIDQLLGQAPGPAAAPVGDASSPSFSLRAEEQAALSGLIEETGLAGLSPAGLFDYAARAINGREFGKFVLSRDVSDLLEELVSWGSRRGLDREALSYLSLDRILAGDTERDDGKLGEQGDLTARIAEARREHEIGRHIHLPILICTATDVFVAPMHRSQPNLFGTGVVRAPVVELDAVDDWSRPMAGHIVCIESADPGYDWVFATGASGLITKYGGANSHMAIRCMETGLPAAIGCGEQLFSRIVSSGFVELDFSSQTVQPFDGR